MSFSTWDPWENFGQAPEPDPTLSARQLRFYSTFCTVWRPTYSYSGTGAESVEWDGAAVDVQFKIGPRPSQYELQDFILSEGDNVFTLDKLCFGLAADIKPQDVIQVTAGPAKFLGGWWKIRGDLQPLTMFANSQQFIAARIPQAPAGIE